MQIEVLGAHPQARWAMGRVVRTCSETVINADSIIATLASCSHEVHGVQAHGRAVNVPGSSFDEPSPHTYMSMHQ